MPSSNRCKNCGIELIWKNEFRAGLCNTCISMEIEYDNKKIAINELEHILQTTSIDNPTIICILRGFIATTCDFESITHLINQLKEEE